MRRRLWRSRRRRLNLHKGALGKGGTAGCGEALARPDWYAENGKSKLGLFRAFPQGSGLQG